MNHIFFPIRSHLTPSLKSVLALSTVFVSLWPALPSIAETILQDSPKVVLDEAWQVVNREYVDENFNQVDWQVVRHQLLSQDYTSKEQAYAALNRALKQLNDPYTRFMDPEQYQALTNQTAGELSGIGIRLKLEDGVLTVVEPLAGSPAIKAGLRAGDQILAIDGRSTKDMTVAAASKLIRGEVGSELVLDILRTGEDKQAVTLTRDRIELPTVYSAVKEEGGTRIGYIALDEFNAHATEQMRKAIEDLEAQEVQGFVLDLRGNPGGLLRSSIEISRMWLNRGAIVRTVDRHGGSEEITANRTALTDLPLAVLVNGGSASSSEIVTGALMDNQRATVVGSTTFGKAFVQSVHSLSDGSGLAVTIAHYYTPQGTDISKKGIVPDIQVKLTDKQRRSLATNPSLRASGVDPQYTQAVLSLQTEILANRHNSPVSLTKQVSEVSADVLDLPVD